jgi:flagellar basal body rod protein FlgB
VLVAIAGAWIANIVINAYKGKRMNKISFKEALDLANLPVITLRQGDKKINLLLDTGSTESIIIPSILDNLEHEDIGKKGTIFGMEGNAVDTKYVKMDLMYNYITYNENFQVVDMSNAFNSIKQSTGVTIHGILGNSFFEKYGYVIDFQELVAYGKNN